MRRTLTLLLLGTAAATTRLAPPAPAFQTTQVPPGTEWIWCAPASDGAAGDTAWFVAEFQLDAPPASAQLGFTADNHGTAWLNGARVAATDEWREPVLADVTQRLAAGRNTVAIAADNDGGPSGVLAFLVADGVALFRTDGNTRACAARPPGFPDAAAVDGQGQPDAARATDASRPAVVVAPYGAPPWGRLDFSGRRAVTPATRTLAPADGLLCEEVASGFGSLIALTVDEGGAPVVSVESGGLLRLHDDDGDGRYERSSLLCDELRACQGLCFVGDDVWATGDGPQGLGFYRLRAGSAPHANGSPLADAPTGAAAASPANPPPRHAELIAPITGSAGEHGPHAVVPGPDGRLWLMLGNHVRLGVPAAASSPYRHVYEGHVLPRIVDPNGHATEVTAPGGTLFAFDPATESFELFSGGYRNAYDLALAPNGDVFTFDSDMEWDIGLPWYRPVRVVHVLPGGDYGWRTGSAKWPAWFPDALPPVLDTGRGSPTGVLWCDSPAFPPRWRGTLLVADWSQGEVLAVHLSPDGCSYRGRSEVLLSGRPLPVTDLALQPGGALLISVGGRGTTGALLRLRAAPNAGASQVAGANFVAAARPPAFTALTPLGDLAAALASPDRAVRYLAARALEQRSPADAEHVAAGDAQPAVRAEALLVRARQAADATAEAMAAAKDAVDGATVATTGDAHDGDTTRARLTPALLDLLAPALPIATRLTAVRALEVLLLAGLPDTIAGEGQPPDLVLGAALLPHFPSGDPALDRELAALLARTEPVGARAALLDALDDETSAEESLHLLYCLSSLRGGTDAADSTGSAGGDVVLSGADADQARAALVRLAALRARPGGASYQGYLDAMERRLLAQAPDGEREALRATAQATADGGSGTEAGSGRGDNSGLRAAAIALVSDAPPRDRERTLAFVRNALDAPERSVQEGAWVFARSCAACHVMGAIGTGGGGPDLGTVGARMGLPDLLTAMMAPSRDVSDQYRATQVFTKSGRVVQGLLRREDTSGVTLLTTAGQMETVAAADIEERRLSRISAMPEGLLDGWSLRAIADLCAFLLAPAPATAAERAAAPGALATGPAPSAYEPLFADGLGAWQGDTAIWSVTGAVLRADSPRSDDDAPPSAAAPTSLSSPFSVSDFTFECEVLLPGGRAGVLIRAAPDTDPQAADHDSGNAAAHAAGDDDAAIGGYVVDLGEDAWGSLSEQRGREVLVASERVLWEPELDRVGWNHLLIEARGPWLRVVLNGMQTAAISNAGRLSGTLAFQLGADAPPSAAFRCVSLRRD